MAITGSGGLPVDAAVTGRPVYANGNDEGGVPQLFAQLSRSSASLPDRASRLALLGKVGIPEEYFAVAEKSFAVAAQNAHAQSELGRLMRSDLNGIPLQIVDDRYLVWADRARTG